jgi:methionyl-tRNA synthetase
MEAVHLRAGLKKLMEISSAGNLLLQYRLDNANLASHPARTHAIAGLALNLAYLLASLASPFMPSTAESIVQQLNAPLAPIPDKWSPSALKSGHKIGKAAYLFTRIPEEKEEQWRNKYGGTQAQRQEEEAAKAKKAADRARDKERKKAKVRNSRVRAPRSFLSFIWRCLVRLRWRSWRLFDFLFQRLRSLTSFQKEAAKAEGSSADAKPADKKDEVVEIPLRGKVAEEQAPPPAAVP